jgi:putative iron-dependent peroxidase
VAARTNAANFQGVTAQAGIFALGTASHTYLEVDVRDSDRGRDLVQAVAGLREPRTTMGGVNLVAGFRPELWRSVAPDQIPDGVAGFNEDIVGAGFTMPALQHDAVLWISGSAYDVVFDVARGAIGALDEVATVVEETSSWPYHHDRDLTGFIDGTENPTLIEAPDIALIPPPGPGADGSILLLQRWVHEATAWERSGVARQEEVIGRRKSDSAELDPKPDDSHVARNDQDRFGKIFRRNMPFGTVMAHGTMFVGFSSEQGRLRTMLESMAGVGDGKRDALTYFTHPVSGAYYFIPSIQGLTSVWPQ